MVSCSEDDSSTNPNKTETNCYPLKVGNSWTYNTNNGSQTVRIDQTVTSPNNKTAYHIVGDNDYTFGVRNLYYEGRKLYGYENEDDPEVMIIDESLYDKNPQQIVDLI